MVGVLVEEVVDDIGIKAKKVVTHTECDDEESWVRLLEEVWLTQKVDQCVDWITNPSSEEEVKNI